MAASSSELRLPSRDGGAEDDGASCDWRYENIAGDMGTFGGGVGGTGLVKSLKAATPGHGSPPGMTRDSDCLLIADPVEERLVVLLVLFLRATELFFLLSSSEDTS